MTCAYSLINSIHSLNLADSTGYLARANENTQDKLQSCLRVCGFPRDDNAQVENCVERKRLHLGTTLRRTGSHIFFISSGVVGAISVRH